MYAQPRGLLLQRRRACLRRTRKSPRQRLPSRLLLLQKLALRPPNRARRIQDVGVPRRDFGQAAIQLRALRDQRPQRLALFRGRDRCHQRIQLGPSQQVQLKQLLEQHVAAGPRRHQLGSQAKPRRLQLLVQASNRRFHLVKRALRDCQVALHRQKPLHFQLPLQQRLYRGWRYLG